MAEERKSARAMLDQFVAKQQVQTFEDKLQKSPEFAQAIDFLMHKVTSHYAKRDVALDIKQIQVFRKNLEKIIIQDARRRPEFYKNGGYIFSANTYNRALGNALRAANMPSNPFIGQSFRLKMSPGVLEVAQGNSKDYEVIMDNRGNLPNQTQEKAPNTKPGPTGPNM